MLNEEISNWDPLSTRLVNCYGNMFKGRLNIEVRSRDNFRNRFAIFKKLGPLFVHNDDLDRGQ